MNVTDTSSEQRHETTQSPDGQGPKTPLRNGLIGGVIAVIISFVPLSTVIGGGIAGYLTDGQSDQQLLAGATAGSVAAIPPILVSWYVIASPAIVLPGHLLGLGDGTIVAGALVATIFYSVGLSILGSFAGGYLAKTAAG